VPGLSACALCSTLCLLYTLTAVYTLERSYVWPPPSLNLLCFRCWTSFLHVFRTFSLSWICVTSACFLHIFVIKLGLIRKVKTESESYLYWQFFSQSVLLDFEPLLGLMAICLLHWHYGFCLSFGLLPDGRTVLSFNASQFLSVSDVYSFLYFIILLCFY
jgi:hypothetical protein